ncbi:PREDICTED: uncharacterized protein LOC104593471 isoform X2 [Nelumbo nucifera]|uniref:Uncharacterized protein LOC104593471 isoform X2 n=1 Tax=Nelumbo nucifera TaxID=4432 RepID=A0A1U8Q1A5_NELNU|nr:PREDICTED: uncharacterized protein LOC104593471 isoform X2 [Nelumbo nucifera]
MSGWSTKGKYSCPSCGFETASLWLNHSKKYCYMCHRRWLEENHKFRYNSKAFDGTEELRSAPKPPSGTIVLRQLENLGSSIGDANADGPQPWKKSILFTLSYWEHHLLRHNIDVMHIEKNVCDNILGTLLNQKKKTKDNYKARLDLEDMGIRSVLHLKTRPGSNTKFLSRACYQMTSKEKEDFLKILKNVRAPDEYSCNISRCMQLKQRKIIGLKSYDCHVLMQELLSIAIKGSLPNKVAVTLCQMEKIFPPSFFTVMVHLIIHLASEAKVGGPIHYRWMYLIERYLLTLKSFVCNRAHPEGSIAEGYLAHECLNFCLQYLLGVETRFNRPRRMMNPIVI